MNKQGLKACPFCGSDKVGFIRDLKLIEITGIWCSECKSLTKWSISMSKNETYKSNMEKWAEKWNRRE